MTAVTLKPAWRRSGGGSTGAAQSVPLGFPSPGAGAAGSCGVPSRLALAAVSGLPPEARCVDTRTSRRSDTARAQKSGTACALAPAAPLAGAERPPRRGRALAASAPPVSSTGASASSESAYISPIASNAAEPATDPGPESSACATPLLQRSVRPALPASAASPPRALPSRPRPRPRPWPRLSWGGEASHAPELARASLSRILRSTTVFDGQLRRRASRYAARSSGEIWAVGSWPYRALNSASSSCCGSSPSVCWFPRPLRSRLMPLRPPFPPRGACTPLPPSEDVLARVEGRSAWRPAIEHRPCARVV